MKNSLVPLCLMLGLLGAPLAQANEELAKAKGCLACHAIDQKRMGPAYKAVAQKYAGQAGAADQLVQKVLKGGAGTWGAIPMPPNAQLGEADAKTLVQWILSLK